MRNFRINFLLIVAVMVIGVTVTTQAGFFGKRVITRCFTQVVLTNCITDISLNANSTTCLAARQAAATHPYIRSANVGTSLPNPQGCSVEVVFCCLTVTEVLITDPKYSCLPFLDFGEGLKKYKVDRVYCKAAN